MQRPLRPTNQSHTQSRAREEAAPDRGGKTLDAFKACERPLPDGRGSDGDLQLSGCARHSPRSSLVRAGFTIVELLLAISAISGLSVLTMTVICLLISAEQHAAETLFIDVTVANLAADLRDDAHRARDIDVAPVDGEGMTLQVTLLQDDETRVTYECMADSVVRREHHLGELVGTDTYRLAFGTSRFEPEGEAGVLTWTHHREIPNIGGFSDASDSQSGPLRTYHIVAALGLHQAIAEETD